MVGTQSLEPVAAHACWWEVTVGDGAGWCSLAATAAGGSLAATAAWGSLAATAAWGLLGNGGAAHLSGSAVPAGCSSNGCSGSAAPSTVGGLGGDGLGDSSDWITSAKRSSNKGSCGGLDGEAWSELIRWLRERSLRRCKRARRRRWRRWLCGDWHVRNCGDWHFRTCGDWHFRNCGDWHFRNSCICRFATGGKRLT